MTKKHFIALADMIREHNDYVEQSTKNGYLSVTPFDRGHVLMLANFLAEQNPRFNRARWLAYIAEECGPNGGKK